MPPPPLIPAARAPLFTTTALLALSLFAALSSLLLFRYLSPSPSQPSPTPRRAPRRTPLTPPLPPRPSSLRHTYYLIRHAESTANLARTISSHPPTACTSHGLTPLGLIQAKDAGSHLASLLPPHARLSLYSSPFLRATQTAEAVRQRVRLRGEVRVSEALRERWFGEWDGKANDAYERVWERDREDEGHEEWGVESVQAVLARVVQWVMEREEEEVDEVGSGERSIALVSHGDTLQIAQTWFNGRSGREHRQLPHLYNAEVRRMTFIGTPQ